MNALTEFSYEASLQDKYASARLRLGYQKPKPLRLVRRLTPTAPVEVVTFEPPVETPTVSTVPLNMLAPPSASFIIALACLKHGVGKRDVMGKGRARHIIAARSFAQALIWQHTQLSMNSVGRIFNTDHSTVRHALYKLDRVEKLVEVRTNG